MPTNFGATNVRRAYDFLTGDGIVDRSGGALQPMTPEAASGLICGWMVETGSNDLSNLDVVTITTVLDVVFHSSRMHAVDLMTLRVTPRLRQV